MQPYPPYSSMVVDKKPLFYWARKGLLNTITIPQKKVDIYSSSLINIKSINTQVLQEIIYSRINKVKGDFRQKEILLLWDTFFAENKNEDILIGRGLIKCSSGTYIRSIINTLGKELGHGAIALSIVRMRVGEKFTLNNAIRL